MNHARIPSTFARTTSVAALAIGLLLPTMAAAQTSPATDPPVDNGDIIVTGIRASLDRSIDIKRNSFGVVDAISAIDIGKFPDTNLAESLQRIPGVSIDRVNGEGSKVTVRGFGPSFNLVTLNGRTMPTASVATVGQDQQGDGAAGTGRSFDFANLASEGVKTLEVYKTARAAVPSGGIGATINIQTRRPLDTQGLTLNLGAKGVYDRSTESGARVTPELSTVSSWTNDDQTFGIGLFASYQKRNSSAPSATVNDWNVETLSKFLDPATGRVTAGTVLRNTPTNLNQLIAFPNDSRYNFSEFTRERLNGQLTVQFKPMDTLTISGDATYFQNKQAEQRSDQTQWFNRPFSEVAFDSNPLVATTVFLRDTIQGTKDGGFEQQYRATKDKLESYGLNGVWEATDNLRIVVDGHISTATSSPDNPNGATTTSVSIANKAVGGHTLDLTTGFPQQAFTFNDNPATGGQGNANGVLDVADLGSQVARTWTSSQRQRVKELRADGAWDFGEGDRFEFGVDYRKTNMNQILASTTQTLGDWGVSRPGDVQALAPGVVTEFCTVCQFKKFNPGVTGQSLVSFRGDATELYNILSPFYASRGNAVSPNGYQNNSVDEEIWSVYGQVTMTGDLGGRRATFVAGVRYEKTRSNSVSLVQVPQAIIWQADNDFTQTLSNDFEPISGRASYDNILPALDFSYDITDNVVGRVSYGKTLARPEFGNLFASATANLPNRPTGTGGVPTGSSGNPGLSPLISDNFDVSLEWYFDKSSYISVGFFDKRVNNFIGTGTVTQNLFGLRDPTAATPGSRSGDARNLLGNVGAGLSDVNLFTMTALIGKNNGNLVAAQNEFAANFSGGNLSQSFIDATLTAYDVVPNANDPLFNFNVATPLNNRQGKVHGFEVQGAYFLGETGFGIQGAYTKVSGDVNFDISGDPSIDQFALVGLSDTANVTGIFDKFGLSARVAYNWRGRFLTQVNRGGFRNPVVVAPYGQLDINISYDISDHFSVSIEGINLTRQTTRTYARDTKQLWFAQETNSRFLAGVRYRF
ncbi:TonB-dependent receptor [Polymorphobacter fuscus]|uniref:TonB-dependent receptor n=1 Tax=Sandarakinorhabdus fusca TaxID=1439888 RepID=A0A7C9GQE7_9SPHN|nr:TonB-dependent receptor [Polymorphobacter fuscus]KAB7648830.1 TonB-dependent receptor [Polymorphobacter fuscus]MQT16411.1 TonB-dependent receptor [Polymorphobacter fuscus]NJC07300.1 TonB-dependent receptor [Polymorphobacter fuscus]